MDLEICYLLVVPFEPPPALGPTETVPAPKDAPYFYDLDIEFCSAGQREIVVEGVPVRVHLQVLDGLVWVAECRYLLADALGETALARKQAIQTTLKTRLQREAGYSGSVIEEYTLLLIQRARPTPDEFVNAHAPTLARLLRSLPKPLNQADASDIVGSRARYSESDLTIVDWVGAIVIAEEGDFQSDIELLKIGNYQLLRYRLLDQTIEQSLQRLRRNVESARLTWLPSRNRTVQAVVEQRLALLLDFEKIDQSLLLIGDWYSARVYRLIVDQFYLDEWKATVSSKLDRLSTIDEIVRQNLTFSWRRALDLAQFVGWLILLVGYFVLFIVDVGGR
ncbi:MAG: hypothetical protein ACRDH2_07960 [Anaerolineales bacterium]